MAVQKCYYCNKELNDEELVIKPIPLATKRGIRNYKRKFHIDCLPKFLEENKDLEFKKLENDDWDKVYEYFKSQVLELPDGASLSQHAVERLLGLRVGQYKPGHRNVRVVKRGYSFSTIYYTLVYSLQAIKRAQKTVNFKNEKHEIDYIMVIVNSNINFVQKRLLAVEMQYKKVEKIKKENEDQQRKVTYKHKGTGKRKVDLI